MRAQQRAKLLVAAGEGEERLLRAIYIREIISQADLTELEAVVLRASYGLNAERVTLEINELAAALNKPPYEITKALYAAQEKIAYRFEAEEWAMQALGLKSRKRII